MRNFGAMLDSVDEVRAAIMNTTCDPSKINRHFNHYYDILPKEKNPVLKPWTLGRYYAFNPSDLKWVKWTPKFTARGHLNTSWYDNERPSGTELNLAPTTTYDNILGSNSQNICSYYVWRLFRDGEVHPDLIPFYSGDPYYNPSLAKVQEAEGKWAEHKRKKFRFDILTKIMKEQLDALRDSPVGSKDGMSQKQWAAQQGIGLSLTDTSDWEDALHDLKKETFGDDYEDEEEGPSIIPMVIVGAITLAGTFALLKWRKG